MTNHEALSTTKADHVQMSLAVKCALIDLVGSYQAMQQKDFSKHDWSAHLKSINELSEAFNIKSVFPELLPIIKQVETMKVVVLLKDGCVSGVHTNKEDFAVIIQDFDDNPDLQEYDENGNGENNIVISVRDGLAENTFVTGVDNPELIILNLNISDPESMIFHNGLSAADVTSQYENLI